MHGGVSVSIDVTDVEKAISFYTQALNCEMKKIYSADWAVVCLADLDIHLLRKDSGSVGAGKEKRHFDRHWTPVHLDFGVNDVNAALQQVKDHGGKVETYKTSDIADIAHCSDPFGHGFCLIRE